MTCPRPLLLGLIALCALPPAAALGRDRVDQRGVVQSPDAAGSYWTPERMRAAESLEPPPAEGAGTVETHARTASVPPDQETNPALDTAYPQRIHGRLFVSLGGVNASCSATVVTARSRDLILTAGHCLVNPGEFVGGRPEWATNVVFVPAYRNGAAPFGVFPATELGAPAAWSRSGDLAFDVAAANLAAGPAGLIQDALGARGVAFNRPSKSYKNDDFEIFGYPAKPAPDYDGERLLVCYSTFRGFEAFTDSPTASPCHQQEGSSGGGWVRNGQVRSVISHGGCAVVTSSCDLMSGTYFGETAFQLYEDASGGISKGKRKKLKRCKRHRNLNKRLRCRGKVQRFKEAAA